MVTLPSCVQLMVLVTGNDQIWFKNLVKIWSEKIWSKSGQNLVKIWSKSGSTQIRPKSADFGLFRLSNKCSNKRPGKPPFTFEQMFTAQNRGVTRKNGRI